MVWNRSIALNEEGYIFWEKLKDIGLKLEMTEEEFEEMVRKVKYEAQEECKLLDGKSGDP